MASSIFESRELVAASSVVVSPPFLMRRIDPVSVDTYKAYVHHRGYWANSLTLWKFNDVLFFPRDAVLFDQNHVLIEEVNYSYIRAPLSCAVDDVVPSGEELPQRKMAAAFAALGDRTQIKKTAFLCFHRYYRVYSHWHCETLFSLFLLLGDLADRNVIGGEDFCFVLPKLTQLQAAGVQAILKCFGLGDDVIVQCDMNDLVLYSFDELIVPTALFARTWLHPKIYEFSKFLRLAMGVGLSSKNFQKWQPIRKIYVSRRDAGARRMVNEEELEAALEKLGFEIKLLSNMSYVKQIEEFSSASLVLGAHGSGFTNLLFSEEGTLVIEIRADRHKGRSPMWDRSFWILPSVLKQSYGFIMCDGDDDTDTWSAPIDEIISTIETLGFGAG